MTADGGRRMSDRLTVFLGVLALAGIAMLGAVILIVVSAAAVVGFAMGLLVMPWLMPLVRTFFRWKGRLRDLPRPRRKDTPAAQGPPEKLLTTGRGPVPAHRGGHVMEFLQANWLWILLGLGVVWVLFFRRGGMGCGMGEHGSHDSRASSEPRAATGAHGAHDGGGEPSSGETEPATSRRHRGCC